MYAAAAALLHRAELCHLPAWKAGVLSTWTTGVSHAAFADQDCRWDGDRGVERTRRRGRAEVGIVLALYTFMADALHVVHHGVDATRMVLPTTFKWAVFAVALALMAAPVAHLTRDARD